MVGKRHYDDPCGLARALNVVGERWALLIVRELLLGPKRFRDLAESLAGVSENVLSTRLRELERDGVIERHRLGPPVSAQVYGLTAHGAELEPVLLALATWGSRTSLTSTNGLSVDALMLALRTTFTAERAADLAVTVELRIDTDTFVLDLHGGLRITRGPASDPDIVLSTDAATLRALVFAGHPLDRALADGQAALDGDPDTAARVLSCFPRPTVGHGEPSRTAEPSRN
jgi:DNA-binding HxlR family transcriptional regulator